jgi:MFS transporter, DHA1 family, multidrug resistance protein
MLILCCKSRNSPPSSVILTYPSAASAIAANTFLRSLAAAGFPLFSQYMFQSLGVNWASTLLGCVAVVLIPIPIVFYIYGAKIRERSAFAPTGPFGIQVPDISDENEVDTAAAERAPTKTTADDRV